jgi:hypothetical protein
MPKTTTFPLPKTKIDIVKEDPQQQDESEEEDAKGDRSDRTRVSGYFFDHLSRLIGAIRRAFNQRSIEWDDDGRSLRVWLLRIGGGMKVLKPQTTESMNGWRRGVKETKKVNWKEKMRS